MKTDDISRNNAAFWDELCGSALAKSLGIADSSLKSLQKFDNWYFDFYPYLFQYIPFQNMNGRKVLEIGLGYGTVSQKLSESGANYTGLDIAQGQVSMANQRMTQNHLLGTAFCGNILEPQLPASSFDYVISIGCLHHTGNLKLAIEHCYSLLKPGGQLILMVYYAYSYRRFHMTSLLTIKNIVKEKFGYRGVVGNSSNRQRAAYDASSKGGGAPHTNWISESSLRDYCGALTSFKASIENIDQESPFRSTPRKELLKTKWPSIVGLDIYATATK